MKVSLVVFMVFASVLIGGTEAQKARMPMLRCTDTSLDSGAYMNYYYPLYHGSGSTMCGGDPLDTMWLIVDIPSGNISYHILGANPNNLYEVYTLPVGEDPVSGRAKLGQFITDSSGHATNRYVRSISVPADLSTGTIANLWSATGNPDDVSMFFVYSRGPIYDNSTGLWNTKDGTATSTYNNPTLWGGSSGFDGVQFVGVLGYY